VSLPFEIKLICFSETEHMSYKKIKALELTTIFTCILMAINGCTPDESHKQAISGDSSSVADPLPVTASAYENVEPLATERISTVNLTEHFARRTFKDPRAPQNYHELIIGTGANAEVVYAYFHFIPLDVLQRAEQDREMLRWGVIFAKCAYLTGVPLDQLRNDSALAREAKDKASFFYAGLHNSAGGGEGIDIRGVHLSVKPYKGQGEIMGMSSSEWTRIRHAIMRGEKDELYSLFP